MNGIEKCDMIPDRFGVINLKLVLLTGLCFLRPCSFTAQARCREGRVSY